MSERPDSESSKNEQNVFSEFFSNKSRIVGALVIATGIALFLSLYFFDRSLFSSSQSPRSIDPDAIAALFISIGLGLIWDDNLLPKIKKIYSESSQDSTYEFRTLVVLGLLIGAFVSYFATVREVLLTIYYLVEQHITAFVFYSDITSVLTFALFILLFVSVIAIVNAKPEDTLKKTLAAIRVALTILILTILPIFANVPVFVLYPAYSLQITVLVMILALVVLYKIPDWIKNQTGQM